MCKALDQSWGVNGGEDLHSSQGQVKARAWRGPRNPGMQGPAITRLTSQGAWSYRCKAPQPGGREKFQHGNPFNPRDADMRKGAGSGPGCPHQPLWRLFQRKIKARTSRASQRDLPASRKIPPAGTICPRSKQHGKCHLSNEQREEPRPTFTKEMRKSGSGHWWGVSVQDNT